MAPFKYRQISLLALFWGAVPPVSGAEEVELAPLMVTVNKQEQALERVAASVTAIAGDELENVGARSLADIAVMAPGLSLQPMGQSGLQPPVMRGMTANAISFSSAATLVVDGVSTVRGQGFDDALLGVERVEVMRGPQSTLYGRNAEAGVVSIVSRQPGNNPYAQVTLDLGSRNKQGVRFDTSAALIQDSLYLGVAGESTSQDGFVENLLRGGSDDDRKRQGGRMVLRWTPDARTDIALRLSRRRYEDGASQWGGSAGPREVVRSGTVGWNRSESRTVSLDLAHQFLSGIRLRSLTARNEHFDRLLQDTDFQPADQLHLGRVYRFRTLSQEFRLEGELGDSRWLAGVYLDRDDNELGFENKLPAALSRTTSTQSGSSVALFTHWDIPLAERWNVQTGLRAERDDIRFRLQGGGEQSRSWSQLTPKLALQYQWQPDAQLYASVADGFRAGGFNTFAPAAYRDYAPEKLRAYELGAKGQGLNRRLRYSAALYRMDVRDMQVQQMGSIPGQVYMTNAATARSTGAEAELRWLLGAGWQLQGALGLNRARFLEFRDGANDYAGKRNPFAPAISAHLGLRYDAPGNWFAQMQLAGYSKIHVDPANNPANRRPGYGLINLSAGYAWKGTELTAYINNAADKHYDTAGFPNSTITVFSPPRELGLRLTWRLQ